MDYLLEKQSLIIALHFLGFLGWQAIGRVLDRRFIEKRFGLNRCLASSFGVIFFGLESESGHVKRSKGFIILLPDRLFYKSKRKNIELDIEIKEILDIYHEVSHKGKDLGKPALKIDFIGQNGKKDCAAFKVPYPRQWHTAIIRAKENINR